MKRLLPILVLCAALSACATPPQNNSEAEWAEWSAGMNAAYTDGPTAILNKVSYAYLPAGKIGYVVRSGDVVRIIEKPDPADTLLWRVRYEKGETLWTSMHGSEGDQPIGPSDGKLEIDSRYTLLQNTENISLEEKQIRLILFDKQADVPFSGLEFFPYDTAGKVTADFKAAKAAKPVILDTERGLTKRFYQHGEAHFQVSGKSYALPMFSGTSETGDMNYLFTGLTDGTSGKTSYGVGRYLDVEIEDFPPSTLSLDFNRLYNPYCARSDAYNCPVMPTHLDVALPYGERFDYNDE